MQNKILKFILWNLIFLVIYKISVAHENHHHGKEERKDAKNQGLILGKVNNSYLNNIKTIFERKCINCHGGQTGYPWYYKFPFAKGLIDSDVAEAKKHLDFSKGFPFKGHGTPKEDLEAISKVVSEGTMPPFRYWVLHWDHRINEAERKAILKWTSESLNEFSKEQKK
ncbi:MAG: hypothetical protein A4S09_06310 [Proteobacteria bacterium SG_bin7]|nr:MAG: hypothetical protein A4S09_06310 [Proteobacteria bacterium SG_bin7]